MQCGGWAVVDVAAAAAGMEAWPKRAARANGAVVAAAAPVRARHAAAESAQFDAAQAALAQSDDGASAALGAAAAAVDSAPPPAAMRRSCSAWILSSSHTLPVASRLTPSMSAGSAAPMVAQADALVQGGRAEGVLTVAGPRGRVHVVAVRAAARRLVLHDLLLLRAAARRRGRWR